jgi:hypothetical protein
MAAARTRPHAANCKYVLSRAQTRGIGLQVKHMNTVDLTPGKPTAKLCCWRCHDTLLSTTGYAQLMRRPSLVSTLTPHAVQQANLMSTQLHQQTYHKQNSNPAACTGDLTSAVQERSYRMLPAPRAGQALVLHSAFTALSSQLGITNPVLRLGTPEPNHLHLLQASATPAGTSGR